ncbi:hypothetical protein [Klebsiella quasipneumoniae]|uniref:hypothetical protein n=1 Tax=Klebsiella quasipneumoniae TaxID=1463165 RepID=UPI0039777386
MTMRPDEVLALTSALLAAMDSEPVELPLDYLQGHKDGLEWAARLAEANHPETGDWLYDDPIELAKAIRKGPDMPPSQPVADSEPVAYRWNYGGTTIWRLLDTKPGPGSNPRCPRVIEPLYRHAQPALVVPDDVLAALQKVARIRLDMNDFDGDRRGIADCLCDAEEALIEVVNRRAAMLNHPEQHLDMVDHSGDVNEKGGDGNSPVIPEGWQVEAEKLAEMHGMSFVLFRHGEAPQCADPTKVVISFTDKGLGHDTLPAAPQKDINALIPLVSRNEQEVKRG